MSAANGNSTLKNLGTLLERHGDSDGNAQLSSLKNLLENSERVPLNVCLAQLKADLSGGSKPEPEGNKGSDEKKPAEVKKQAPEPAPRNNARSESRLQRVMAG